VYSFVESKKDSLPWVFLCGEVQRPLIPRISLRKETETLRLAFFSKRNKDPLYPVYFFAERNKDPLPRVFLFGEVQSRPWHSWISLPVSATVPTSLVGLESRVGRHPESWRHKVIIIKEYNIIIYDLYIVQVHLILFACWYLRVKPPPLLVRSIQGGLRPYAVRKGPVRSTQQFR